MINFDTILHTGKRFVCYPIVMYAVAISDTDSLILNAEFAVAKRIMKKAVYRNRVKRQMRAIFRNILKDIDIKVSLHIIFFYNHNRYYPFIDIQTSMYDIIEQASKSFTITV